MGSGLAVARDLSDRTLRTAEQIERLGLECIGAVPPCPSGSGMAMMEPGPAATGSLRSQTLLRMLVASEAAQARIVGVASPVAGEEAAVLARDFVQAAARSHRKALLIGPDRMRADRGQHGPAYAPEMPAGYDLIVVCLPPLEDGAAFRLAARQVDGILLAVDYGAVDIARIERAFSVAGVVPSDFIGAVLIGIDRHFLSRFGDRFWRAQALVAAHRRLLGRAPAQPASRSA